MAEIEYEETIDELKAISFIIDKIGLGVGVEEHPFEKDGLIYIGSRLSECIKKLEEKR